MSDKELQDTPMPERLSTLLIQAEREENEKLLDMIDVAWGIIANAYGGDWDLASPASGWKEAAERWRDEYHDLLDLLLEDDEGADYDI